MSQGPVLPRGVLLVLGLAVLLNSWLDLLIHRARAKDPDERWQSASDIATYLREMPGVVSTAAPSPPLARLRLPIAPATDLAKTLALGLLAVSPAGDMVAYVGTEGGQRSVFVRRLDQAADTLVSNCGVKVDSDDARVPGNPTR